MTTFKDYPYWAAENDKDVKEQLREICSIRKDDVSQIANLTSTFIGGRSVGKIPTSSSDVTPKDKVGDFNVTATFAYYLIDNSGNAEWRRVAVGSF